MPQLIRLRGRAALSSFRLNKLHLAFSDVLPDVRLTAEFWHFARAQRVLARDELQRLERLLTYGPKSELAQ
ncbi:MAG: hypothetical protein ACXWC3_22345, partial [Burkholderiales bacterium]